MKNLSLILNAILLLAVIYLFYAHFSGPKPVAAPAEAKTETAALNVVYVREDTLLNQFKDFHEKMETLNNKKQQADASLQSRGRALEKEVAGIQAKIQQGLLTPNQIATEEQRIAQKQQSLMQESDKIAQEIMSETQTLNNELQDKVKAVLEALRDEMGYDYILNYGPGTGVLMVNDSLDITSIVLERLNQAKKEGE